ncbi:unnamed protein product [Prorocentrum cordatum]|uniref:Uncharacterized protein n=1 Tax=Prorocentrum cordatum TaxID=2364126 RepID=A0ABN9VYH7_9DINO|nr:unnamed protein product [Polarella glacialis]
MTTTTASSSAGWKAAQARSSGCGHHLPVPHPAQQPPTGAYNPPRSFRRRPPGSCLLQAEAGDAPPGPGALPRLAAAAEPDGRGPRRGAPELRPSLDSAASTGLPESPSITAPSAKALHTHEVSPTTSPRLPPGLPHQCGSPSGLRGALAGAGRRAGGLAAGPARRKADSMPHLRGGPAGRGVMTFEILHLREKVASIYEPTDSCDLRRRGSKTLLLPSEAPGAHTGASPDCLSPKRRARSMMICGATGGCRACGSQQRRVGFSPPLLNSAHEVTPYASQYGVHPSFFDFDRGGEMRLTDLGIAENMRRKEQGLDPLMLDGKEVI